MPDRISYPLIMPSIPKDKYSL